MIMVTSVKVKQSLLSFKLRAVNCNILSVFTILPTSLFSIIEIEIYKNINSITIIVLLLYYFIIIKNKNSNTHNQK